MSAPAEPCEPWKWYVPPRVTRRSRRGDWGPPFDDAMVGCTAYHEAAHAIVATSFGRSCSAITIVPDADTLGRCTTRPFSGFELGPDGVRAMVRRSPVRDWIAWAAFATVAIGLAGHAAEFLWFEEECHPSDLWGIGECIGEPELIESEALSRALFLESPNDEHASELFTMAAVRVVQFLNRRSSRLALGRIAHALDGCRSLSVEQIPPFDVDDLHIDRATLDRWACAMGARAP
jgi:hypothetical protein